MPSASTRSAAPAVLAITIFGFGALAAIGCSATGTAARPGGAPLPGTDACVFLSNIEDWQVIDDSTLIVYAPLPKDAYLLKLFEPVPDLDFRNRVGFDDADHNGQICGNGTDYLVLRGEVPRRVPIVAFRKLTLDQAKQLLPAAQAGAGQSGGANPAPQRPATGQH